MKQSKKHLPVLGVGPTYVAVIIIMTICSIFLSRAEFMQFAVVKNLKVPLIIVGVSSLIIGNILWIKAFFQSQITKNIKNNSLVITGVYAYVRNPIYSAYFFICIGVILFLGNVLLLILPVMFWIFLTVLMKATEEKWLEDLYQEEYLDYCKKVNRCIPWFKKQ